MTSREDPGRATARANRQARAGTPSLPTGAPPRQPVLPRASGVGRTSNRAPRPRSVSPPREQLQHLREDARANHESARRSRLGWSTWSTCSACGSRPARRRRRSRRRLSSIWRGRDTAASIVIGSPYHELVKPIPRSAKAALVVEIILTYARVRRLLLRHDLPTVVATLRGPATLRPTAVGRPSAPASVWPSSARSGSCRSTPAVWSAPSY